VRYPDHAAEWADFQDRGIQPDLGLFYSKPDSDTLEPVRLGSHGELRRQNGHS
jgi:mRNA-degrading endonuclease YafQ of YafQ-DinJ toxin-antitoxin module